MPIHPTIHAVFGHFQNLNLLALLQDLSQGRIVRRGWSFGENLCPVAHGLPTRKDVKTLNVLGQTENLTKGCHYAAECLGADEEAVFRFVSSWDEEAMSTDWFLHQLLEIWEERLIDAEVVQGILTGTSEEVSSPDFSTEGGACGRCE